MGSLPFHRHRPNRRLGWLALPGSAMNSSIRPVSSGSPSLSIQVMQLQSPSPSGKPYEYWLLLPFASEGGDEKLESRLRQEHVERLDRQTVLARRRENAGVVRDDAGEGLAVPQTLHDLPGGEAASVRIEPEDGRSRVGGDACMAGQEQALERGRARAATAPPVPEGSEDSRDERPGAIAGERQDGDRAAGRDGGHRRTFSGLSRALL